MVMTAMVKMMVNNGLIMVIMITILVLIENGNSYRIVAQVNIINDGQHMGNNDHPTVAFAFITSQHDQPLLVAISNKW